MRLNLESVVENELVEDDHSVWCLKGHGEFGYSDGRSSERYLQDVFAKSTDLSTHSAELETYIKDWPSEYHLSTKRAQLLAGFSFDSSLSVLEVGCGCGAITRHLGENFEQVISVEGNINRARLAKQRSKELDSVSVICAPFQEIRFQHRFDVIFCIGVLEYSAAFIESEDPYDAALKYFADMLNPDGIVVIAIENQFGLKYFSSAHEDHLGVMFEGLEGYHQNIGKVRTFGKAELESRLKNYFREIEFYYPYPDYKIPECVIADEFLASGKPGELISQMRSRNYSGQAPVLWDEAATVLELARNGMLDFFANSFLVLAGRKQIKGVSFDQQAVIFSSGRKPAYSTRTSILKRENGELVVEKRKLVDCGASADDETRLRLEETDSPWIDELSLHSMIYLRARSTRCSLREIFEPCSGWLQMLTQQASTKNGVHYLDGNHIDSLWPNTYLVDGAPIIIDKEWVWQQQIRLNVVVIRAIYDFLCRMESLRLPLKSLSATSGKKLVQEIASILGVSLDDSDFVEFLYLETELSWIVSGISRDRQKMFIRWFLLSPPSRRLFRRYKPVVNELVARMISRVRSYF